MTRLLFIGETPTVNLEGLKLGILGPGVLKEGIIRMDFKRELTLSDFFEIKSEVEDVGYKLNMYLPLYNFNNDETSLRIYIGKKRWGENKNA